MASVEKVFRSFLLIDGHAEYHIKELRDAVDAAGFAVTREARTPLSAPQARALLELECAANAEAAAAAAAAISPRAAAGKAKAPPKKGAAPEVPPWGTPVAAVRDVEVASLSAPREKVLVLALEKVDSDAIAELRGRVGPSTAAEWVTAPGGCWAAAFTYTAEEGAAPYRVLHVAVSPAHAERFWALFNEYETMYRCAAAARGGASVFCVCHCFAPPATRVRLVQVQTTAR